MSLLEVRDLRVDIVGDQTITIVRGVSFELGPGEILAMVGESGSGKSATALALSGLHGPRARVGGSVRVSGEEVVGAGPAELARIRGSGIGIVFQDPAAALHPLLRVGDQLLEAKGATRARALDLLEELGVPEPPRRLASWPHELSGGMRQRVLVAMALLAEPAVLVLDEATTALDVVTAARVLSVVRESVRARESAALVLTHDMGAAASVSARILVLYAGRAVEEGPTGEVLASPRHPYTAGLLACVPSLERDAPPEPIPGAPPSPREDPEACAFAPRCPRATERCRVERPTIQREAARGRERGTRAFACFHPLD